jgi:hypothetical protein
VQGRPFGGIAAVIRLRHACEHMASQIADDL